MSIIDIPFSLFTHITSDNPGEVYTTFPENAVGDQIGGAGDISRIVSMLNFRSVLSVAEFESITQVVAHCVVTDSSDGVGQVFDLIIYPMLESVYDALQDAFVSWNNVANGQVWPQLWASTNGDFGAADPGNVIDPSVGAAPTIELEAPEPQAFALDMGLFNSPSIHSIAPTGNLPLLWCFYNEDVGGQYLQIASDAHATPAFRPFLRVTYTADANPIVGRGITKMCIAKRGFR